MNYQIKSRYANGDVRVDYEIKADNCFVSYGGVLVFTRGDQEIAFVKLDASSFVEMDIAEAQEI